MSFQTLPLEVHCLIVSHIDDDTDFRNYGLTCPESNAAINCNSSPVWRNHFVKRYDLAPGSRSNDLRHVYLARHQRAQISPYWFLSGQTSEEKRSLILLRDLINESYSNGHVIRDVKGNQESRNLDAIQSIVRHSGILHLVLGGRVLPAERLPLLVAIQVVLTHLRFNGPTPCHGFPDSQQLVYTPPQLEPLFAGIHKGEINMQWLLNCANFFKHHMTIPQAYTLGSQYNDLPLNHRPQPWKTRPSTTSILGKHWFGIYSFLDHDELHSMRSRGPLTGEEEYVEDGFNEGPAPFQRHVVHAVDAREKVPWPDCFEQHLRSKSHPSRRHVHEATGNLDIRKGNTRNQPSLTRAQARARTPLTDLPSATALPAAPKGSKVEDVQFYGEGVDDGYFSLAGWLTPLPSQEGIHGWRRFTMMKFFTEIDEEADTRGGNSTIDTNRTTRLGERMNGLKNGFDDIDMDAGLWAYEGVAIPGCQIIIGRWWHAASGGEGAGLGLDEALVNDDEVYSGPFMIWCVD